MVGPLTSANSKVGEPADAGVVVRPAEPERQAAREQREDREAPGDVGAAERLVAGAHVDVEPGRRVAEHDAEHDEDAGDRDVRRDEAPVPGALAASRAGREADRSTQLGARVLAGAPARGAAAVEERLHAGADAGDLGLAAVAARATAI